MKKQIKKTEVKKEPFRFLPDLYDWCDDVTPALLILGVFSSFTMILFGWLTVPIDQSIIPQFFVLNLHGINPWFIFGMFLLISELIFIWIANNTMYSTDMPDVTGYKLISLGSSAVLTTWILSGFVLIRHMLKNISLEVIWNVVSFFGIGVIVIGGTYLYLKINQWIAKKVSSN